MIQLLNMVIRFLTPEDVLLYRELRLSSLQESPFAFSDSYEDQQSKTITDFEAEIMSAGSPLERFALGAFSENRELIGFVKFRRDERTKARHRASLHSLYVAPAHRGKGIAEQLISELIRIIEPLQGLEQLQLSSIISKTSLIAFYEKFGFQKLGDILKEDLIVNGQYVDALYMVRYLNR